MPPKTISSTVAFTDPQNTVLANGKIVFTLSSDAAVIGGGQIVPSSVSVTLDSTGKIPGGTQIYANDQLQPTGTLYYVEIFNSNGLRVNNPDPLQWILSGASPIDLSFLTSVGVPDPGLGSVVLQNPVSPQTITGQAFTLTTSTPLTVGNLIGVTQTNGIATTGGQMGCVARVDLTSQTAAITTTTLYAVPSSGAGEYRLSWNAKVTTVGSVSSTLGALTIVYTDPDSVVQTITCAAQISAGTIATTSTGNSTTTVLLGVPMFLNCKASTNITYAMAYASNSANSMNYNLHIGLEAV